MNSKRAPLCFAIAALILFSPGCGDGGASTSSSALDAEFVFKPDAYPELAIKGAQPDGTSSWSALPVSSVPTDFNTPEFLKRGQELYAKGCAACHGANGKGEGILNARVDFNIPPANFTKPIYSINIRSTQMGTLPQDADLFRSITRGMPGTGMMSYRDLPDADRWALVRALKEFWAGSNAPPAVAIKLPAKPASSLELVEAGRDAYRVCANCHGPAAMGGTAAAYNKLTGKPYPGVAFARNGGHSTLGGATDEDLARTLLTGFGLSSPMMSVQASYYGDNPTPRQIEEGDRKLWATVFYVKTLLGK